MDRHCVPSGKSADYQQVGKLKRVRIVTRVCYAILSFVQYIAYYQPTTDICCHLYHRSSVDPKHPQTSVSATFREPEHPQHPQMQMFCG